MERSLSVLLPVHNAQATLAATVLRILDVVADLTGRFELVIVDDGSDDATVEVAQELTCHYPQVRAVRHRSRLGREAAIRTALKASTGEMVVVSDETGRETVEMIHRLWGTDAASDNGPDGPAKSTSQKKWTRVSSGHSTTQPGFEVIDRRAWDEVSRPSRPSRPNYLSRLRNFARGE